LTNPPPPGSSARFPPDRRFPCRTATTASRSLEGTCTWTIDGETHDLGAGESVCIRRGQVHGFENRTDEDLKFLAIATPGVFGPAYFHEVGDVLARAAGGPPDLAAMVAVMRRHGLTPALPAGVAR
jgi:hypothetical protein